ncbi:hypothetical protein B2D07_14745 [Desulfococcus multivorans]|jgi:hypothetical protein|nr:hypothetical protein B2D07_14745 [Desulfococcus multivorans]
MKGGGDASGKGCGKNSTPFLMATNDAAVGVVIGCEVNARGLSRSLLSFRKSEELARVNSRSS